MASEIAVAVISGGTGLVTGAIASLIAPWANWGIEKRRLTRERRIVRIAEWRAGVGDLDWSEKSTGKSVWGDEITSDIHAKSWYVTLRPEMAAGFRAE